MPKFEERKPVKVDESLDDSLHVHTYLTEADVAEDHQHIILGVSGPPKPEGMSHIHRMRIRTSYTAGDDCGHWHWVDTVTGPASEMPNGAHTHYFCGETSSADGHCHSFADATGLAPDQVMEAEEEAEEVPVKHKCKYKRMDQED